MNADEPMRGRLVVVFAALALIALATGACARGDSMTSSVSEAPFGMAEDAAFEGEAAPEMLDRGRADGVTAAQNAASSAPLLDERQLIFTGQMELRVADTLAAMDEATRWTVDNNGFVEQSSTHEWDGGVRGSLVLRMPSDVFDDGREAMRSMADEVLRDEKQRQDVTGQYADMNARLDNLKAAEAELRDILSQVREEGGTAEEVLQIYRELTRIRGEIDGLQAQLDTMTEQIAFSTLSLSLTPLPPDPTTVTERWRPLQIARQALADLVGGLQNIADFAIYFTIAILPQLLILLAVLWLLYRLYRRFRPRRPRSPAPAPPVPDE